MRLSCYANELNAQRKYQSFNPPKNDKNNREINSNELIELFQGENYLIAD